MSTRLNRRQVAWRIAQDIEDGAYVNLGIGQPELVADFLPTDREVVFHSENGILGMGPTPPAGEEDFELINAGKKAVTMVSGGAFFHHADSFAMIRGGHIDVCVLGAFQISAAGDLANWSTGGADAIPAVGGAMDLAVGAKRTFVMSDHCTRQGEPKIVTACTYPLTAVAAVDRIYTDLAVMNVTPDGIEVEQIVAGMDFDALQAVTGAPLLGRDSYTAMTAPDLA